MQRISAHCDGPLPTISSHGLLDLLSQVQKKSAKDPRPSNPLGLKAPLEVLSGYCHRHRFEQKILPKAKLKSLPQVIQWEKIEGRVSRIQPHLQALVEDPLTGLGDSIDEFNSQRGAKWRCIFWRETLEVIKGKAIMRSLAFVVSFSTLKRLSLGSELTAHLLDLV